MLLFNSSMNINKNKRNKCNKQQQKTQTTTEDQVNKFEHILPQKTKNIYMKWQQQREQFKKTKSTSSNKHITNGKAIQHSCYHHQHDQQHSSYIYIYAILFQANSCVRACGCVCVYKGVYICCLDRRRIYAKMLCACATSLHEGRREGGDDRGETGG